MWAGPDRVWVGGIGQGVDWSESVGALGVMCFLYIQFRNER